MLNVGIFCTMATQPEPVSPDPQPNGKTKTPKAGRKPGFEMSQEHKDALALGRAEGRAVRDYLDALVSHKPKRGRKRTSETVEKRLNEIEHLLDSAQSMDTLRLLQERRDLQVELLTMDHDVDLSTFEEAFIEVGASYSRRHGIDYATWREIGVPAGVLKAAGISRGGF